MNSTPAQAQLVLVVEDEPAITEVLEGYLRREGFRTERAADGEAALKLYRAARPDLVLLDVMLPKLDGFAVLRHLREAGDTPVIMVTARLEDLDKLVGLRMGADDYVVKPFSPPEVVERVKAVLRRSSPTQRKEPSLRLGRLEVDPISLTASIDGTRLDLTLSEYRLLEHFARYPKRTFSRAELQRACLLESDALERVVDAHIGNLRKKLERTGVTGLETVWGVGYRFWTEG